jgi:site-specific recombinase XerC
MTATFIWALGTTGRVLRFLEPNEGHNKLTEGITCYIKVRFVQSLPIGSVYTSRVAVLERHSRMCSITNRSQKCLQDRLRDCAIGAEENFWCMRHSYRQRRISGACDIRTVRGEFLVHATFVQAEENFWCMRHSYRHRRISGACDIRTVRGECLVHAIFVQSQENFRCMRHSYSQRRISGACDIRTVKEFLVHATFVQ